MTRQVESVAAADRTSRIGIRRFCDSYRIGKSEEHRLIIMFGEFATAAELFYNISRAPRWRW